MPPMNDNYRYTAEYSRLLRSSVARAIDEATGSLTKIELIRRARKLAYASAPDGVYISLADTVDAVNGRLCELTTECKTNN